MAIEILGMSVEVSAAWLIWILPFAAALIMPGIGKLSKKSTGYVAVGFALNWAKCCSPEEAIFEVLSLVF